MKRWAFMGFLLLTVLVFLPAVRGPQLFDDVYNLEQNPSITTLWPITVPLSPPRMIPVSGRPITNFTYAVNFALNSALGIDQRPDPDGPDKTTAYHLTNQLLHLACALLLFGILRRTLRHQLGPTAAPRADGVALAIAALWAVHPLQTAVVDYMMARTDLMVSVFALAVLYAAIRAWDAATARTRTGWYVAGIVLCALGMGAKETMAIVPLIILLYDRAFRTPSWRALFRANAPGRMGFYAGLWAMLVILVLILAQRPHGGTLATATGMPWYAYFISQGNAIGRYLLAVVDPGALLFDHGRAPIPLAASWPGLLVVTALAILTLHAWRTVGSRPWLAFAGAWFFLLLAPSSSIIPLGEIGSDRRMYLPLLGAFAWLAFGWQRLRATMPKLPSPNPRYAALVGCLALGAFSFHRSTMYRDPVALWRDAAEKRPDNARAALNLASALIRANSAFTPETDSLLEAAILRDPRLVEAPYNLALSALSRGDASAGEQQLLATIHLMPGYGPALQLLSRMYLDQRHPEKVIPILTPVVDSIRDPQLYVHLGIASMALHDPTMAVQAFGRALAIQPGRPELLRSLGAALLETSGAADAVPYLQQLTQVEPGQPINVAMLGLGLAAANRAADAMQAANAAVETAPGTGVVLAFAGRAAFRAGALDSALTWLERATRSEFQDGVAWRTLGEVYLARGDRARGASAIRAALKLDPADTATQSAMVRLSPR